MLCGKCGKTMVGGKGLCPVSFGLAIGITCALAVLFWAVWISFYGPPTEMSPMMTKYLAMHAGMMGAGKMALWALVKGFVFGFFVALFYDFIACYCKGKCCKTSDGICNCGCAPKVEEKK